MLLEYSPPEYKLTLDTCTGSIWWEKENQTNYIDLKFQLAS